MTNQTTTTKNLANAGSRAKRQRQRRMDRMRGITHTMTAKDWVSVLKVKENTVRMYASELGETCKPAKRPPPPPPKRREHDYSLMLIWASIGISDAHMREGDGD